MSVASPLLLNRDSLYLSILTSHREQYLSSLKSFIHGAWHLVEPKVPLAWNWHLDEYCELLEAVTAGQIKRLIINQPPGTSKSITLALWSAWEWALDPGLRYLTVSYDVNLTIRDNLRVRDIVTSEWYRSLFWEHPDQSPQVTLASDQNVKIRFDTTLKGWRIATSVDGRGTGEHPNRIILDDLLKASDAKSDAELDNVTSWLQDTLPSRVRLDPAIILVMQRLHLRDPTAFLLGKGGYTHIVYPMRYHLGGYDCPCHKDNGDLLDHREHEGELLWPEVFTEEKVTQMEIEMGPLDSPGQLEQNPIPIGGGLFKREWFEIVDAVPDGATWCTGWDTADTDIESKKAKRADWTVGVTMARHKGTFYVAHVIRTKTTTEGVDKLITSTAMVNGKRCKIREGSGSGKATTDARLKSLAGYDYEVSPETESKEMRAKPFRQQAQGGNVKLVRGEWNVVYLDVLSSFPVGKHDDDVDASANAFNALCDKPKPRIRLSLG